jgi:hypothetical protein
MTVYGERIAKLEERVDELSTRMARVEDKLDQLLELKNKGAGAFWLVSLIIGSGIITAVVEALHWFRH